MDEIGSQLNVEDTSVESVAEVDAPAPAMFWETLPWRRLLAGLAVIVTVGLIAGAFILRPSIQVSVTQFMIPPYSYVCLALAVLALVELKEPLGRRLFMAIALLLLTGLSILSYAVGEVGPLVVLGVHMGFLIGWVAWPRRAGWTLLWLVETLAWIGLAFTQDRLFV